MAKAQSVRSDAAGAFASPDRCNGSNELSQDSGDARRAARPPRAAPVKAVVGISEDVVQVAKDGDAEAQEHAVNWVQCPVGNCEIGFDFDVKKASSKLALHCRKAHKGRAWSAVEKTRLRNSGLKACGSCRGVFARASTHKCVPEAAPAQQSPPSSGRTVPQASRSGSAGSAGSYAAAVGAKAGSSMASSRSGSVSVAAASSASVAGSEPRSRSGSLAAGSSVGSKGSKGSNASRPVAGSGSRSASSAASMAAGGSQGLREGKELERASSVATQVLEVEDGGSQAAAAAGAEGKYDAPRAAAPAPASELPPALKQRVHTFKRLPRSVWATWRNFIAPICAEYEQAKQRGEVGDQIDALERLLDAPNQLLRRDGGVAAIRQRFIQLKQAEVAAANSVVGGGADTEGGVDQKALDGVVGPVRPPAEPRNCLVVPDVLLQKKGNPATRRMQNVLRSGAPKATRKAASVPMESPVAQPSEAVYDSLRRLHPQRDQSVPLPERPRGVGLSLAYVDEETFSSIVNGYRGKAAGPSNWTADMLMPLLDDNDLRKTFISIICDIANNVFDQLRSPLGVRLRACVLTGLVKDLVAQKLRPVAMGELFLKVAAACVVETQQANVKEAFQSVQFGVGRKGGSESASIVANAAVCVNNQIGMALLDQGNAFNQIPRDLVLRELYARPQFNRLFPITEFAYGEPSPLLMYGRNGNLVSGNVFCSEQGVRQGCALGSLLYAIAVQSLYTEALAAAGEGLVAMIAVMDDVCVIGRLDAVRRVVTAFRAGSAARGLELNVDKCVVLQPQDPALASDWQRFAADNGFQKPQTGATQWLGTAIGYDAKEMRSIIARINDVHKKLFEAISGAELGAQNALLVLRACVLPRATYALRTSAPFLIDTFVKQFDADVQSAMAAVVQRKAPADGSGVFGPAGDSYRLSLSRGGVGLRSTARLSPAAYVSAAAVAIGYMTAEQRESLKTGEGLASRALRVAVSQLRLTVPNFLFDDSEHGQKQRIKNLECKTTAQFVDHYARVSAVGLHMQQRITELMEQHQYDALCQDPRNKARLQSAGAKSAYQWLTCLPTEQLLCMSDLEVVRALRHRIGVAPIDNKSKCVCGTVINDQNFDHLHVCQNGKSRKLSFEARHNTVQKALACIAAEAGVSARMDYGGSGAKEQNGSRLHPDGVLHGLHSTGADVVTDVALVNPTAGSRVARAGVDVRPLQSVRDVEGDKRGKYRDFLSQNPSVFCPFVAESYGAFGKGVKYVVAALARRFNERSVPSYVSLTAFSFTQWANRVLAVSIQRANARLVEVALRHRSGGFCGRP